MNGSRKRRRTRSSAVADESASKRPNRSRESHYHAAVAKAATEELAGDEKVEVTDEPSQEQAEEVVTEPAPEEVAQAQSEEPPQEQREEPRPVEAEAPQPEKPKPASQEPPEEAAPLVVEKPEAPSLEQHQEPPPVQEQLELLPPAPQDQEQQRQYTTQHEMPAAPASYPVSGYGQNGGAAEHAYVLDNWTDPSLHLRIQSLPILENLSIQILETLVKGAYQETLTIVTEPESAPGQAYATLKALFDQTKRLYSQREPFLSAHDLNLREPEHRSIIRKANLATFVSSVFGSQDVGFYHLNEYFLETFVQEGGRLLKSQGALFLDLKTQAYLSAMANGERSRAEILEDLFPDDLGERLMSRRPLAKQMTPSEVDFVKRARSRCDHLLSQPDDADSIAALPDKYVWEDFLRDVSGYVSRHFDDLVGGTVSRSNLGPPAASRLTSFEGAKLQRARPNPYSINEQLVQHLQQQQQQQTPHPDQHQHLQAYSPSHHRHHQYHAQTQAQPFEDPQAQPSIDELRLREALRAHNQQLAHQESHHDARQEVVEKAARAAEAALQNELLHGSQVERRHEEQRVPRPEGGSAEQSQVGPVDASQPYGSMEIPYHTQSAPTQVLYERARLAATAKASPNSRRAGLPSQRRPWTTDEENALMAGLDRVKGPHWSQILAMFGAGGTINESLKDRNQVQLKDKARNLKLFFLKSGIEVPYYLQFVTGELKTRAPSQAAKNEAKERARLRGDEDRAHVEGVLALAGGARQNSADETVADPDETMADPDESRAPTDEADYERQMVEQLQEAQRAEEVAQAQQAEEVAQTQQAEEVAQAQKAEPEPEPEPELDAEARQARQLSDAQKMADASRPQESTDRQPTKGVPGASPVEQPPVQEVPEPKTTRRSTRMSGHGAAAA
ncbi:MAG: TTAGGG repeat binding factor [Thelocarpon impressellum]|nr:MAG: TTAGGG repeat binding factor [Thelocarpon impressellum]